MKIKIAIAIFVVLVVVGALAGIKALQIKTLVNSASAFAPPPETVASTTVKEEKWQSTLTAIGSIVAVQGVTVSPDLPGIVREIAFESGAVVAKGDLLVRLDTSSEEAQLRAMEAQVQWARVNFERNRTLRNENTLSQSELDSAEATMKQNQGNADTIRASIEKKTIRAPFAGKLGIRQINLGQYLETGKPIVSLQSLAPVCADFSLPQQQLAKLHTGMPVRVTTDTYPGRQFEGSLAALNPDLDASTRSVGIQGCFENKDEALRPGMYVRVEVLLPEELPVLVIPATAVLSAPFGDSVYLVESKPGKDPAKPQLTVRQQFIRTGRARGDFVTVESGLKAGERVVSVGLFKLRNGMTVVENNSLVPKGEKSPTPPEG
jgi:membrane fusion protein (multidrug efflux system)